RRAALAVEEHYARPVLLAVLRLGRAEELGVLLGHMIVLHDLDRVALVAQAPELGNVVQHEHVAVHEHRPAAVVAKPGREEAGEREVGGLQRIARAAVNALELREPDRRDGDGLARALVDRVRENAEGHGLALIVPDKDLDQRDLLSGERAAWLWASDKASTFSR